MSRGRRPTGCLPESPARGCVYLGDKAINLSAISRATGICKSFLSLIMTGRRGCTVKNYRKIAAAIGMGLEDLLDSIDSRVDAIEAKKAEITSQYETRIAVEDKDDKITRKRGRIPKPRLPGLRLV